MSLRSHRSGQNLSSLERSDKRLRVESLEQRIVLTVPAFCQDTPLLEPPPSFDESGLVFMAASAGTSTKTFKTDSHPDLDFYQPCNGGDNQINFPINVRDLDLANPDAIDSARLTLRVFDVDFTCGFYPCERDEVYFNGHRLTTPGAYLTGADSQWSTVTFDVDPNWILDGDNAIRVQIDVLNGGWCVTVDWGELAIELKQEVRVEQLFAFDDLNIVDGGAAVGDKVWDVNVGTAKPIADATRDSFSIFSSPGKLKIETHLGVDDGEFPQENLNVNYKWEIPGSGKSGNGSFTATRGDDTESFVVDMPGTVGKYSLNFEFKIYGEDGTLLNTQSMSHTLYATLNASRLPTPKTVWLDKATSWAAGSSTADQVVNKVFDGIQASGWLYRDPGAGGTTNWQDLVEGRSTAGNCFTFAYVWNNISSVLGVATVVGPTTQTFGATRQGFVTKPATSLDGITGNAHTPGAAPDRWFFGMHQVGKYGSTYYDPTFHKKWSGSLTDFIQWNVVGTIDTDGDGFDDAVSTDGGYVVQPTSITPSHGWGDNVYFLPTHTQQQPVLAFATAGRLQFTSNASSRGVDLNGDGFFDSLAFDLQLNASAPGQFVLTGQLSSGANFITKRSSYLSSAPINIPINVAAAGNVPVTVFFSGEDIRQSGLDGPYTASLAIRDATGVIDTRLFQSGAFDNNTFGEIPLSIQNVTDQGLDTNSNSRFEALVASVDISALGPTTGWLVGNLYSPAGDLIATADPVPFTAAAGASVHDVSFSGAEIFRSRVTGNYVIEVTVFDDLLSPIGYDARSSTNAYAYTQFESGNLSGNYADHGVDTNGNGLSDLLVVEADAVALTDGQYTLDASLYDAAGQLIESVSTTADLNAGLNTLALSFSGVRIYENHVDGPYYVKYAALREVGGSIQDLVEDAFQTKFYAYRAFEAPVVAPVALTGNYSDRGIDANADGIYEQLAVRIGVTVQFAGSYAVNARLLDSNQHEIQFPGTTVSFAAPGTYEAELRFNGSLIFANRVNGPYFVRDVTVYRIANPAQQDSVFAAYTTGMYHIGDFGRLTNVSPQVNLTYGQQMYDRRTGQILSTVTITNNSTGVVSLPARLVLESLSGLGVTLANATGLTPSGEPYIDLAAGIPSGKLLSGQSAQIPLVFNNPSRARFTYTMTLWGFYSAGAAALAAPESFGKTSTQGETGASNQALLELTAQALQVDLLSALEDAMSSRRRR